MRHHALLILTGILLLVMAACSTATCPMDTVVTCNYTFYNSEGATSPLYDTLTVTIKKATTVYTYSKEGRNDSILLRPSTALIDSGYTETISTMKLDTVLMNSLVNGTAMSIPMSFYNRVDTLIFYYRKILHPDTVYLFHEGYTHVETPECGSYRFHHLSGIRSTDRCIDHIEVVNPTVNFEGAENVRIYFNSYSE